MGVEVTQPHVLTLYVVGWVDLVLKFLKMYDTCMQVCRYWEGIVNPIFGCGDKMAPDINPIYAGLERSCPRDSKNVSYVDVGLV